MVLELKSDQAVLREEGRHVAGAPGLIRLCHGLTERLWASLICHNFRVYKMSMRPILSMEAELCEVETCKGRGDRRAKLYCNQCLSPPVNRTFAFMLTLPRGFTSAFWETLAGFSWYLGRRCTQRYRCPSSSIWVLLLCTELDQVYRHNQGVLSTSCL